MYFNFIFSCIRAVWAFDIFYLFSTTRRSYFAEPFSKRVFDFFSFFGAVRAELFSRVKTLPNRS